MPKGNKVWGFAPNKFRNTPQVDERNVTVHAEQAIIRELLKSRADLKGCTIYIARVNTAGKSTISRPCARCMPVIVAAGIKEIVYTNELGSYSVERVDSLC